MAFWGSNGLFLGFGEGSKAVLGCIHMDHKLLYSERCSIQTESDYNATLWPPTDQLKLDLAQLSLSVMTECGNNKNKP